MNSSKHWHAQAYSLYVSSHIIFIETAEKSIRIHTFQEEIETHRAESDETRKVSKNFSA